MEVVLTETIGLPVWLVLLVIFAGGIACSRWMHWAHEAEVRDLENQIDRIADKHSN